MLAGIATFVLLVGFSLSPLYGVAHGMPWLTLAITFVLIPLLDAAIGNRGQPPPLDRPLAWARWVPRAQVPVQAVLLVAAVTIAPRLGWGELLVFALAVGTVTGGIGITVAHELGHRASRLDRALAKALLVTVLYGHFFVEHVRGHHVRVGTPDDPATAPRGMNVYRFWLRSVGGSFIHAWRLEALRLSRTGGSAWSLRNWVLTGSLLSVALVAAAWLAAGEKGLAFFIVQGVFAFTLLEVVNYVEHYGLRRSRDGARYEAVAPRHSWNADYTLSNWLLLNLQLHSDHHAHMERPFETLRSMPQAPQLPAGYPTMVVAALVPPLWFALIDPRLPAQPAPAA
ncbi:MAG: alkane 1-monooxygenase [Burkholderiales bacterium]|jgi:alkane 1-monooxygenase|nr:alkane 1-monooxygenase [Burkholderiales bacterium]